MLLPNSRCHVEIDNNHVYRFDSFIRHNLHNLPKYVNLAIVVQTPIGNSIDKSRKEVWLMAAI